MTVNPCFENPVHATAQSMCIHQIRRARARLIFFATLVQFPAIIPTNESKTTDKEFNCRFVGVFRYSEFPIAISLRISVSGNRPDARTR